MASDDITDQINTSATGPKKVRDDMGEMEQHPLPDLIAADNHLRAKDAKGRANRGLRFSRMIPPGMNE